MKKFTLSLLTIAAFLSSCDPTETEWEEQTLPSFLASDSPWESMGIFDVGDVNMNCPEMDYLFVEDGSIEVWFANCVPPNYPTFARWDLAKRRATEMVYPDTNTLKLGWQMPLYSRYIDDKFYVVQSDQNTVEYYTKDGTTLSTVLDRYLHGSTCDDARIAADKSFSFNTSWKYQGISMAVLRVYNYATGEWDAHMNMQNTTGNCSIYTSAFSSEGGDYTGYVLLRYQNLGYQLARTSKSNPLPSPLEDGFNYYQLEMLTWPDMTNDGDLPTSPSPGILHSRSHPLPVSFETADSWYFLTNCTEWVWPDYSVPEQKTLVVSTFRMDKASNTVEPDIQFAKVPEGVRPENLRFGPDGSLYGVGTTEDNVFIVYKITPSETIPYLIEVGDPGEDYYYHLGSMKIVGDYLYVGLIRSGYLGSVHSPLIELVRMKL